MKKKPNQKAQTEPTVRGKQEVERVIGLFKRFRKSGFPEINGFGDNNWRAIDDKVSVLEALKDADELDIENARDDYQSDDEVSALDWLSLQIESEDFVPTVEEIEGWEKRTGK